MSSVTFFTVLWVRRLMVRAVLSGSANAAPSPVERPMPTLTRFQTRLRNLFDPGHAFGGPIQVSFRGGGEQARTDALYQRRISR